MFSSVASKPFYVHYEDKMMKINVDDKMAFLNLNGNWDNLYEFSSSNVNKIREFINV